MTRFVNYHVGQRWRRRRRLVPPSPTINWTTLTSGVITPSGANIATASITPAANRLLLATVAARFTGSPGSNIFSVTGNGLTWNRLSEDTIATGASSRQNAVFWALTGGAPSAGAVTFAEASAQSYTGTACAAVMQFSGIDLTTPLGSPSDVQDANPTTGSFALTTMAIPGTPLRGDITFAAFFSQDNANDFVATPSTWMDVLDVGPSTENQIKHYINQQQDLAPDWNWTSVQVVAGAIGVIIRAAGNGGAGGFTAKFRRTMSALGTRVGSRQRQGHS